MSGRIRSLSRFYITAENRGTCRALWCSVGGTGHQRVRSLHENSLTMRATVAATALTNDATEQAEGAPRRVDGDGEHFESSAQHNKLEFEHDDRHARREKAQAAATAATTQRAIALSAALEEDDDEAMSVSIVGRKPLFASRHNSTDGMRAGGRETAVGNEHSIADGETVDNDDGPVNIVVVSRCRPLLVREMRLGVSKAVFCDGSEIVVSDETLPTKRSRRFGFDRVFGKSVLSTSHVLFCPMIGSVLYRRFIRRNRTYPLCHAQPKSNCYDA